MHSVSGHEAAASHGAEADAQARRLWRRTALFIAGAFVPWMALAWLCLVLTQLARKSGGEGFVASGGLLLYGAPALFGALIVAGLVLIARWCGRLPGARALHGAP